MRRAFGLAALLLAAAAVPAFPQARHPLGIEQFVALDRVAEPAISPDGRWVAYTVTTTDLAANRRKSDVWLSRADGTGAPVRVSTDSLGGRGAQWAPDGRRIAYISSRGGTPQVHIRGFGSGEGTLAIGNDLLATGLSTGADGVLWSPSGRMLAFVSSVYPPCADDACNRRMAEEAERRPSRARIADQLLYRHWMSWSDGTVSHLFVVPADGSTPPKDLLAGRDWETPVAPFGGPEQYAWSPDEREIAFTTKLPTHDAAWTTNLDIYTVPVAGGEPTLVTANMPGAEQNPVYSPDGRWLAFLSQQRPGFESDRWRLMVKDRQGGQVRELTHDFDDYILEYTWNGPDILAVTEQRQRHRLLHIVAATGTVHHILDDMDPSGLSVAPTTPAATLAFVSDALDRPPQVWSWVANPAAPQRPRQVTHLNAARLAGTVMNPAREFAWMGANGDSAHGLLLVPPGFDSTKKYPAVILIHGGPQGAWLDSWHPRWNAQLFAAPGYVVAMLNPHGSTGFGQAYVDAVSRHWGSWTYEDIMRGTDVVAALPFVDSTRMAAAGGSFGGYMANWILGHTNRFKAIISHDGIFNLESAMATTEELWFPEWEYGGPFWVNRTDYDQFSPHRFAQNFRTPTLVIHGGLDFRLPETEAMGLFTALQRQGVPSRFLEFPDEGHFVTRAQNQIVWWTQVQGWLARWIGRQQS